MDGLYTCDACGEAGTRDEVNRKADGVVWCDDCVLFGPPAPVVVATGRCALASCGKALTPPNDPAHSVQWHCVNERAYCSVFCFMGDGACPCHRSHCE